MSSWFAYIRNSIVGEEEEAVADVAEVSASTSSASQEEEQLRMSTTTVPSLSQEQQQHIREVLRRAERSGRGARVVMDSRHLRVGRPTRAFHGGGADGTSAEMPTAAEEKETALTAEIVQMDTLPEDVEITVGPYSSYCSYASSQYEELMSEESEMADRGYNSRDTTELNIGEPESQQQQQMEEKNEQPMAAEEDGLTIAQRMQNLSKKIDKWLKNLDNEEEEQAWAQADDEHGDGQSATAAPIASSAGSPVLLPYLDTFSRCICTLAMEQSVVLQANVVAHFADKLAEEAIHFVLESARSQLNDRMAEQWARQWLTEALEHLPSFMHCSTEEEEEDETVTANCYTILVEEEEDRRKRLSCDSVEAKGLHICPQQPIDNPAEEWNDLPREKPNGEESEQKIEGMGEERGVEAEMPAATPSPSTSGPDSAPTSPQKMSEEEFQEEERKKSTPEAEPQLTKEELEHIEWIKRLAEQSSFEATTFSTAKMEEEEMKGPQGNDATDYQIQIAEEINWPTHPTIMEEEEVAAAGQSTKENGKLRATAEEMDPREGDADTSSQTTTSGADSPSSSLAGEEVTDKDDLMAADNEKSEEPFSPQTVPHSSEIKEEANSGSTSEADSRPPSSGFATPIGVVEIGERSEVIDAAPPPRPPPPPMIAQNQIASSNSSSGSTSSADSLAASEEEADDIGTETMPTAEKEATGIEEMKTAAASTSPFAFAPPESSELTLEELEHIERIRRLAEVDLMQTVEMPSLSLEGRKSELTIEELQNIERVRKLAEEDSGALQLISERGQLGEVRTLFTKIFEAMPAATSEEAKKTTAASISTFAPSQELTQEELEHIEMVTKLAEQSFFQAPPPAPPTALSAAFTGAVMPTEPELTREELEQIERIKRLAEEEDDLFTIATTSHPPIDPLETIDSTLILGDQQESTSNSGETSEADSSPSETFGEEDEESGTFEKEEQSSVLAAETFVATSSKLQLASPQNAPQILRQKIIGTTAFPPAPADHSQTLPIKLMEEQIIVDSDDKEIHGPASSGETSEADSHSLFSDLDEEALPVPGAHEINKPEDAKSNGSAVSEMAAQLVAHSMLAATQSQFGIEANEEEQAPELIQNEVVPCCPMLLPELVMLAAATGFVEEEEAQKHSAEIITLESEKEPGNFAEMSSTIRPEKQFFQEHGNPAVILGGLPHSEEEEDSVDSDWISILVANNGQSEQPIATEMKEEFQTFDGGMGATEPEKIGAVMEEEKYIMPIAHEINPFLQGSAFGEDFEKDEQFGQPIIQSMLAEQEEETTSRNEMPPAEEKIIEKKKHSPTELTTTTFHEQMEAEQIEAEDNVVYARKDSQEKQPQPQKEEEKWQGDNDNKSSSSASTSGADTFFDEDEEKEEETEQEQTKSMELDEQLDKEECDIYRENDGWTIRSPTVELEPVSAEENGLGGRESGNVANNSDSLSSSSTSRADSPSSTEYHKEEVGIEESENDSQAKMEEEQSPMASDPTSGANSPASSFNEEAASMEPESPEQSAHPLPPIRPPPPSCRPTTSQQSAAAQQYHTSMQQIGAKSEVPLAQFELSQQELEHIERIRKLAEEDFMETAEMPSLPLEGRKADYTELTIEELENIERVRKLAEEEDSRALQLISERGQLGEVRTLFTKIFEAMPAATSEEAKKTTAASISTFAPSQELTQEELEHIEMVTKLAEQSFFQAPPPPPALFAAFTGAVMPAEPELTREELEHIERIKRLAEEDDDFFTIAFHPTHSDAMLHPSHPPIGTAQLQEIDSTQKGGQQENTLNSGETSEVDSSPAETFDEEDEEAGTSEMGLAEEEEESSVMAAETFVATSEPLASPQFALPIVRQTMIGIEISAEDQGPLSTQTSMDDEERRDRTPECAQDQDRSEASNTSSRGKEDPESGDGDEEQLKSAEINKLPFGVDLSVECVSANSSSTSGADLPSSRSSFDIDIEENEMMADVEDEKADEAIVPFAGDLTLCDEEQQLGDLIRMDDDKTKATTAGEAEEAEKFTGEGLTPIDDWPMRRSLEKNIGAQWNQEREIESQDVQPKEEEMELRSAKDNEDPIIQDNEEEKWASNTSSADFLSDLAEKEEMEGSAERTAESKSADDPSTGLPFSAGTFPTNFEALPPMEAPQLLTQEELEHIAQVQRMAEEQEGAGRTFMEAMVKNTLKAEEYIGGESGQSSSTSSADYRPSTSDNECPAIGMQEGLTPAEMEHIRRVEELALESGLGVASSRVAQMPEPPGRRSPSAISPTTMFEQRHLAAGGVGSAPMGVEEVENMSISSGLTSKADSVPSSVQSHHTDVLEKNTPLLSDEKSEEDPMEKGQALEEEEANSGAEEETSGADSKPTSLESPAGEKLPEWHIQQQQDQRIAEKTNFDNVAAREEESSSASTSGADSTISSADEESINGEDSGKEEKDEDVHREQNLMADEEEEKQLEVEANKVQLEESIMEKSQEEEDAALPAAESSAPPRTSAASLQLLFEDSSLLAGKRARQHSLTTTTTISYTNAIRGRRWLSVTDNSMDQQEAAAGPSKGEESRKSSSSSVKIIFTDEKLRQSFCDIDDTNEFAEALAQQEIHEEKREEVEQKSSLADNIDFMIKLDFFAQRITEQIAEEAVNDITAIVQIKQNPRALYFDDKYADLLKEDQAAEEELSSASSAGEEEEEETGEQFAVQQASAPQSAFQVQAIPAEAQQQQNAAWRGDALLNSFGTAFSSLLGRRRSSVERPRSALPFLLRSSPAPPAATGMRKTSEDANMFASAGLSGTMASFLRKSSAASIPAAEEGVELPDEVLAGLSEKERAHILRVVAEARQRLPSSAEASRSSSAMLCTHQQPADVDQKSEQSADHAGPISYVGLDEAERRHVESVIQKAAERRDSPFVIPIRRQESLARQETVEVDLEGKEAEQEQKLAQARTVNQNWGIVGDLEIEKERAAAEGVEERAEESARQSASSSLFALQQSLACQTAETDGLPESSVSSSSQNAENITQKKGGEDNHVQVDVAVKSEEANGSRAQAIGLEEELNEEELAHIRRVAEQAMLLEMELLEMSQHPTDEQRQQWPTTTDVPTISGMQKQTASALSAKFSGGIQSLSEKSKKFKEGASLFGGFTTKLFGESKNISHRQPHSGAAIEENVTAPEEVEMPGNLPLTDEQGKEMGKSLEFATESSELVATSPESPISSLEPGSSSYSPSSPQFWLQANAAEGEETPLPIGQPFGHSLSEADESSGSSSSSGFADSMHESIHRCATTRSATSSSGIITGSGQFVLNGSAHSLTTLAELVEEQPLTTVTKQENKDEDVQQQKSVVDEICWFKQEMEKMNQALLMEEDEKTGQMPSAAEEQAFMPIEDTDSEGALAHLVAATADNGGSAISRAICPSVNQDLWTQAEQPAEAAEGRRFETNAAADDAAFQSASKTMASCAKEEAAVVAKDAEVRPAAAEKGAAAAETIIDWGMAQRPAADGKRVHQQPTTTSGKEEEGQLPAAERDLADWGRVAMAGGEEGSSSSSAAGHSRSANADQQQPSPNADASTEDSGSSRGPEDGFPSCSVHRQSPAAEAGQHKQALAPQNTAAAAAAPPARPVRAPAATVRQRQLQHSALIGPDPNWKAEEADAPGGVERPSAEPEHLGRRQSDSGAALPTLGKTFCDGQQQPTAGGQLPRVPTPISCDLPSPGLDQASFPAALPTTKTTTASDRMLSSFSSNPKPAAGFGTFGNKFSKFTSSTLKGAKQAGEQLGARAVSAVGKANQAISEAAAMPPKSSPSSLSATSQSPPRPHSSLGFSGPTANIDSAPTAAKSASLANIFLPPGFEQLSEEEQLKIMAVLQCAQIDAELEKSSEERGAIVIAEQSSPATTTKMVESSQPQGIVAAAIDQQVVAPDLLTGLSEEEQRQIMAVMRAAEEEQQTAGRKEADGGPMPRTAIHAPLKDQQQLGDQPAPEQTEAGSRRQEEEESEMEKEEEEAAEEEAGDADLGVVVLGESLSFLQDLAKYGQPVALDSKEEGLDEVGEDGKAEMEEDEDLWIQPPRPEFTAPPEHWDNVPVSSSAHQRKLWTTVFTEEAAGAPEAEAQMAEGIGQEIGAGEEQLPEISAETVRGCWELGGGKSAQEVLMGKVDETMEEEEKDEEAVVDVARRIYANGFGGGGVAQKSKKRELTEQPKIGQLLREEHSNNNSYEVEMEDPWSPSFVAKSMDQEMAFSAVGDSQNQHKGRQMPAPPKIMVTEEKMVEEEEENSDEEEVAGPRGAGQAVESSSSSGDEDADYPDQVIRAPTVSPATIAALQEETELEQQKIAAEVLQQIQAFGEVADDEFDVQWAKPSSATSSAQQQQQQAQTRAPKLPNQQQDNFFMEDAANVYSPPDPSQSAQSTNDQSMMKKMQMVEDQTAQNIQKKGGEEQQQPGAILYRQRTNPFLMMDDGPAAKGGEEEEEEEEEVEEEEEEEGQDAVIVRQEHLDAEDRDPEVEDAQSYYKAGGGQFDHSLYFAHRPGPVYTIPENPEEEKGTEPNREGIYHAERVERKPLHSETVPSLIPAEAMAASARRRSNRLASAASSSVVEQRFWTEPGSTFAEVRSSQQKLESRLSEEELAGQHLTPIRSAPPPPGVEKSGEASLPSPGPQGTAQHLQQQLQLLNQHKFVNKAKDIAQQEDLPPPPRHATAAVANGGAGLGPAAEADEQSASLSPRLKRSPAMNLACHGLAEVDQSSAEEKTAAATTIRPAPMPENAQPKPSLAHSQPHHHSSAASSSSLPASSTAIAKTSSPLVQAPAAAAEAMGRRRLPSLPSSAQQPSYFASTAAASTFAYSASATAYSSGSGDVSAAPPYIQPSLASLLGRSSSAFVSSGARSQQQPSPPVVYYTSCLPEKRDVGVNGDVRLEQPTAAEGRVLFDASLVANAQSAALSGSRATGISSWNASRHSAAVTTTATANTQLRSYGGEPLKPSVFPGATFRPVGRTSPAFRPLSALLPASSSSYLPSASPISSSLSPPTRRLHQQQQPVPARSRTVPARERATQEMLCQLMFKKELREALAKRRELLDTSEIEASHRQYLVDRWMRTGILPANLLRPAELEAIPAVVKCTLPAELVAGARIVPTRYPPLAPRAEPARYGLASTSASRTGTFTSLAVGSSPATMAGQQHQQPQLFRSIACQADGVEQITGGPNFFVTQRSWRPPANLPSTSLRSQLKAASTLPVGRSIDVSTQTALCAETQTDPSVDVDEQREHHRPPALPWPGSSSYKMDQQQPHDYCQPWEDAGSREERMQQQWEQRHQQWQGGRRRRGRLGRFLTTSDTQSERGQKERLVREELERRRRQLALEESADAFFLSQQQQPSAAAARPTPYSSGSLPRDMEFGQPPSLLAAPAGLPSQPHSLFPSPGMQQRQRNIAAGYGSLPRDYERRIGVHFSPSRPLLRPSHHFGQPMSAPLPAPNRHYSQSMQELDRLDRWHRYPHQQQTAAADLFPAEYSPPYASRSTNYLDRMDFDENFVSLMPPYRMPSRWDQAGGMDDDLELMEAHRPDVYSQDLLSNYANYLNRKFMLDQRQMELADREQQQQQQQLMFERSSRAPGRQLGGNYYGQQRSSIGLTQQQPATFLQQHQPSPQSFFTQPQPPSSAYDLNLGTAPQMQPPGVYSRNEVNYGARPPAQWTTDYGNLYWRSRQPQQQPFIGTTVEPARPTWPSSDNFAFQQQQQQFPHQQRPVLRPNYGATMAATNRLAAARQQQQQQQQRVPLPPQSILRRRAPPLQTMAGNEVWPSELGTQSRGAGEKNLPLNGQNEPRGCQPSFSPGRSGNIKRLLLTRRFKHDNFQADLGIRVVGGKKVSDGDLCAFITFVDKNRAAEMLGELREGDQVLEWNGVLLNGKTYEEVERIIQSSTGEIELIVKSGGHRKSQQLANGGCESGGEGGTDEDSGGGRSDGQNAAGGGKRSIAFAADSTRDIKWHSPNEPPPVPAHQSNNNNSISCGEQDRAHLNGLSRRHTKGADHEEHPLASNFGAGRGARLNGSHGYLQLALAYDEMQQILHVRIIAARALRSRIQGRPPNPFVKIYLMPNRRVSTKRRTKCVFSSTNPVWDQALEYLIGPDQLAGHYLELTVFDYDRDRRSENQPLGGCLITLSDPSIVFSNTPRWFALQTPVTSPNNEEDGNGRLENGNGAMIRGQQHQQHMTKFQQDYNPATLDMLNGYPAIA